MAEYIDREVLVQYIEKQEVAIEDGTSVADAIRIQGNAFLRCVETIPTADVVEKEKYDRLLKIAKKMHAWIFLNTGDEQAAYDECGLTDEENVLLGYGGKIELCVREEEK